MNLMAFKCNYPVIYGVLYPFQTNFTWSLIGSNGTSVFFVNILQATTFSVWTKGLSLSKNVLPISYAK